MSPAAFSKQLVYIKIDDEGDEGRCSRGGQLFIYSYLTVNTIRMRVSSHHLVAHQWRMQVHLLLRHLCQREKHPAARPRQAPTMVQ